MVTAIFCEFSFNSAHWLPKVHETHKCRNMHGHTYRVSIEIGGEVRDDGFVVDYDIVRKAWEPLFAMLDHKVLNDVQGLDNPTCEIIAAWIAAAMWPALKPAFVAEVKVRETETAGAIVRFGEASRP